MPVEPVPVARSERVAERRRVALHNLAHIPAFADTLRKQIRECVLRAERVRAADKLIKAVRTILSERIS